MKKIKNINIVDSLNTGRMDTMYETIEEIDRAFPDMEYDDREDYEEELDSGTPGFVKHADYSEDNQILIQICNSTDKWEIFSNISKSNTDEKQFVNVPAKKEKILKRR